MGEIIQLNESHIDGYTEIAYNAYPSFKNFDGDAIKKYKETVANIMNNDPAVHFYGFFEEGVLIGVMRLFDFKMNGFGKLIPVSGLGFLGVHLLHKKKGVARELIRFFESYSINKKVPIALLLPFRPDFYKRMGYGFGTKMNQYRMPTSFLPSYDEPVQLKYLCLENLPEILRCHQRAVMEDHGRMLKFGDEIRDIFGDAFNRVLGSYDDKGILNGYMVYQFKNGKSGNYTINHLYVKELIYECITVLKGFMGYLKKQEDQVKLVVFNTEDEHFHYLFSNPLNDSQNYIPYGYLETNTQAIGVMYKLLDIKMAFEQCNHRQYNGVKAKVRFLIQNDFTQEETAFTVCFNGQGASTESLDYEVTIALKQSDFSALFLGCTSVVGLHQLGLLTLDDVRYLNRLDLAFYYPQKPVCYTDF